MFGKILFNFFIKIDGLIELPSLSEEEYDKISFSSGVVNVL